MEVEMWKKFTSLGCKAHLEVKSVKDCHVRTTFGSCDVEKVHSVLARSTSGSENVQSASGPDDFWKLRCGKCTLLWRQAHLEVSSFVRSLVSLSGCHLVSLSVSQSVSQSVS